MSMTTICSVRYLYSTKDSAVAGGFEPTRSPKPRFLFVLFFVFCQTAMSSQREQGMKFPRIKAECKYLRQNFEGFLRGQDVLIFAYMAL